MKEYWINVYEEYIFGAEKFINSQSACNANHITPMIYRLHVKLKNRNPKYEYDEQSSHSYSSNEKLYYQRSYGQAEV